MEKKKNIVSTDLKPTGVQHSWDEQARATLAIAVQITQTRPMTRSHFFWTPSMTQRHCFCFFLFFFKHKSSHESSLHILSYIILLVLRWFICCFEKKWFFEMWYLLVGLSIWHSSCIKCISLIWLVLVLIILKLK